MGKNGSTCFASEVIELRLSPAGFRELVLA